MHGLSTYQLLYYTILAPGDGHQLSRAHILLMCTSSRKRPNMVTVFIEIIQLSWVWNISFIQSPRTNATCVVLYYISI